MEKGPNQPQHPGHRRRRRRRGSPGKKQQANGGQPQQNGSTQSASHSHGGPHGRSGGGGGGQQRRNRSRRGGGQTFVGPMDHSYRSGQANGNIADNGNRANGAGFQQANRFPVPDMTPVASRPDAPARIFCFIDDLFFFAKIQEIAKKLNVKVEFVKTIDPILERAQEGVPEDERPSLIVIDLNNLAIKPLALMPKLRAALKRGTSIVGFVSHIQGDLKMKAQEAGFDVVMPRSAFSQNLPQLLRRHGSTVEEMLD
jgi:CheY-like chemotaxis protein